MVMVIPCVIMVDKQGRIFNGDALLYIIALDRKLRNRMSGGVVGTQMSNLGFELALQRLKVYTCLAPLVTVM